jgi:hypothetical protein
VCCYLCIISCNRLRCSRAIFADCIVEIQTWLHMRTIQQETLLYSNTNTNITSTINIHRAAQPLPDRWRPMLVCMMKGYAPMLRYHNQLHQQLGHEMKPFRFPPLHRSPSPVTRVHCSTPHKPKKCFCAAKHPRRHARTVLAIILTTNPLNSDRLMIHTTSPARREAAEIAAEFPFEHASR